MSEKKVSFLPAPYQSIMNSRTPVPKSYMSKRSVPKSILSKPSTRMSIQSRVKSMTPMPLQSTPVSRIASPRHQSETLHVVKNPDMHYTYVLLEPVLDDPKHKPFPTASDLPRDGSDGRPPKKGGDRYQVARKLATKAYNGYYKAREQTEFRMIIRHKTMNPLLSKSYGVYDVKIVNKNVKYTKIGKDTKDGVPIVKNIKSMIQAKPYKVDMDVKLQAIQKYVQRKLNMSNDS